MNCKKVQRYLQDYIEGELDQVTAQGVAQHLQSCSRCIKELEYLKKHLSYMKDLETVRAPKDFLERVHRRIEESPEERRFFHTLFSPLRFKIPLELSAVAAMVIAVIFVLQVTRPVKRQEPVVVDKEVNITRAQPYEKREKAKAEKLEHVQEAKPSEYPASESTLQAKKIKPAEKTVPESISQTKELQPSEGAAALEESPAERTAVSSERPSAPERKGESKAGSAEALPEEPAGSGSVMDFTVVMVLPGEMKDKEETMKKTSSAAARAPAEYDRVLSSTPAEALEGEEETYRPEQAEKASEREKTATVSKIKGEKSTGIQAEKAEATENPVLEKAAEYVVGLVQSEGGVLVAKSFPNIPGQPFVVTADIPGSHINSFFDQLGSYGKIQVPPNDEAEKKAITVRIRIEIRLPVR